MLIVTSVSDQGEADFTVVFGFDFVFFKPRSAFFSRICVYLSSRVCSGEQKQSYYDVHRRCKHTFAFAKVTIHIIVYFHSA